LPPAAKVPWASPLDDADESLPDADAADALFDATRLWAGDDETRLVQASAIVKSSETNNALLADLLRAEQLHEAQRGFEMRSLQHPPDRRLLGVLQDRQRSLARSNYARIKRDGASSSRADV
jgi:hypothetical protein